MKAVTEQLRRAARRDPRPDPRDPDANLVPAAAVTEAWTSRWRAFHPPACCWPGHAATPWKSSKSGPLSASAAPGDASPLAPRDQRGGDRRQHPRTQARRPGGALLQSGGDPRGAYAPA